MIDSERLADGLAVHLRAAPGLEAALARLIELERECCSADDVSFELLPGTSAETLRLEIRGVDPDAALFRSIVPAPSP